ncbi:hypothetical protein [Rhodococcus sp. SJ-3]|uniref:hypothetical protein n=1 Tax=Rhodococcus sp. SJ-3 TaxID=3454628 RepID=UPI003F7A93C2
MATATERRLAAQIAAHESWANTPDRRARTAAATQASAAAAHERALARYEAQIDPHNKLDPAERRHRAKSVHHANTARARLKEIRAQRLATEAAQLANEAAAETAALGI